MSARHYPQIPTLALAITFTLATLAAPLAAETFSGACQAICF